MNGAWVYNYGNKVLFINGMRYSQMDYGNPFINKFAGGAPPEPVNVHLTVISGSPGRWMVRDASTGLNHLFERL